MKKSDTQELKKIAMALAKQEIKVKAMQKLIVRLERQLSAGEKAKRLKRKVRD